MLVVLNNGKRYEGIELITYKKDKIILTPNTGKKIEIEYNNIKTIQDLHYLRS